MSTTFTDTIDPWLPRQLPVQLVSLGELYREALASGGAQAAAGVGWRLYAALTFAVRVAPLPRLAELTGLTVDQLDEVLVEFADGDAPLTLAA